MKLFYINHNLAGCLPDNEGWVTDDAWLASQSLIDDIELYCLCEHDATCVNCAALGNIPNNLADLLADAPEGAEFAVWVGDYYYFVRVID